MKKKEFRTTLGGKELVATFSDMASKADGSVLLRLGDTSVLATAVMSDKPVEGNFFPLRVDYEERFYAAGMILGGQFIRREGRPSDEAVLTGRVVDRTIRPLFNQKMRNEVQVVLTALSIDEENDPDVVCILASSLALATSRIPWAGPVGAIRVGKATKDGEITVNPSYKERIDAFCELLVCGKDGKVNMIESGAKELDESEAVKALTLSSEEITKLENWQKEIIKEIGVEKTKVAVDEGPEGMKALYDAEIAPKLKAAVMTGIPGGKIMEVLLGDWLKLYAEKFPEAIVSPAESLFNEKVDELVHEEAVKSNKRPDGRNMNQLRELYAQAGGFSNVHHGAGLFYRGETHVLSVLTLGGPKDSQLLDGMEVRDRKYFMHHYNFPPFCSGEVGRVGGMNRRAIGHGALAEKALMGTLPSREEFPYTIRIVSESLTSNGSTSMGSVCASTLALMDAGVPIKRPTAGIAMGLMMLPDGSYKVLTDIQGPEDHHGDMDFKVAGTREGITAIQMDVKVEGIPVNILAEALTDAKAARYQILDVIEKEISVSRTELKHSAPKIVVVKIDTEKIGAVIGPGGKIIQGMQRDTGATIDIEEDGTVTICGRGDAAKQAAAMVEAIVHEYKAGERFEGPVTRMLDFGAFVRISPQTEGLVHVSELAPFRVDRVDSVVNIGDVIPVVVKEVDERGRVNLSLKMADPDYAARKGVKPQPAGSRMGAPSGGDRRDSRGGGRDDKRGFFKRFH